MQNYLTIFINGSPFNCDSTMSLHDLLNYLSIDVNLVIIEYNHVILDMEDILYLYPQNNDSIEIISIAGGG